MSVNHTAVTIEGEAVCASDLLHSIEQGRQCVARTLKRICDEHTSRCIRDSRPRYIGGAVSMDFVFYTADPSRTLPDLYSAVPGIAAAMADEHVIAGTRPEVVKEVRVSRKKVESRDKARVDVYVRPWDGDR